MVIPKLSRNRTEDNANGLNIKTRTDRKKKTLIEEEKLKQYYTFKGSKFSKLVERDFEDDKLIDIRTKSDIHLQSNPEEDAQIFGATDFYFKTESYINTYEFDFRAPGCVIFGSSNPSTNEESHDYVITPARILEEQSQSSGEPTQNKPININAKTRKLGAYNAISADKTFNIGIYDVLGQTVTVKYHVAVSNGNPINEIIISSNLGTTNIGNTGIVEVGVKVKQYFHLYFHLFLLLQ